LGAMLLAAAIIAATPPVARADPTAASATASKADAEAMPRAAPLPADASKTMKARALVDAAIKMTNSDQAVTLLWQATDIDPTLDDPYIYLGLYYNSRSDFQNVVKVYKKLVKYQPSNTSAYLNIGEAYMSLSPPQPEEAINYYRKAYEVDPNSSFAALRIGEVLARKGNRNDAIKYLKQATGDSAKNPTIASEAEKSLRQLGVM
ncbi:MAG: tetratricopeptide repeat protein, partial [Candidatus Binataceae bacterium]